jgi:N-acetylglucosaminyldiphosphoundecaprenol N-acetyl-beta-D-mannosaminyltransferase
VTRLLPRASLRDLLRGNARLIGSRLPGGSPRGYVSPIEARLHMGIAYGDLRLDEERYFEARTIRSDAGVLVRAAISRVFAQNGVPTEARPLIVSARVDNLTVEDALDRIFLAAPRDRARMVHFAHPHSLTVGEMNRAHAGRLARADLVLPDGIGVRLAGAVLGTAVPYNLNGTDLLPLICQRAVKADMALALIGGQPGVVDECARRLLATHPGLRIPIVRHGFLDVAQIEETVMAVRSLSPCLVLVGMGSPLQEEWAWQHLASVGGAVVLTVGGLFDFYSERIPRAPKALRELGLEWTFRLWQEPRRLARRYLLGIPFFLGLVLRQRLRRSKS